MTNMKKFFKWTLIIFGGLIICITISIIVYIKIFYVWELNQIKKELNNLENVEVVNIWGHQDITLEEISARVRIKGKGEIVLGNLDSESFDYPNSIPITEIGNYSFTIFTYNGGIGPSINIGIKGNLGHLLEKEFTTIKDVIDNYDLIYEMVKELKMSPEINHLETETYECYLLVHNKKTFDQDPIFNLLGIENLFKFAKTLKWNRADSYYNKNK
jgi:hypothetical protein